MKSKYFSFFIGILVFVIPKYAVLEFIENTSTESMYQEVQRIFNNLSEDTPSFSETELIRNESLKISNDRLSNAKTSIDELQIAASIFFGYYVVNIRTRARFCANYKVDISRFIIKFSEENINGYLKAKFVLEQNYIYEEDLYISIEPTLIRLIKTDMQDISNVYQLSMNDTCELFNKEAEAIVSELQFSKVNPNAHRVLLGQ